MSPASCPLRRRYSTPALSAPVPSFLSKDPPLPEVLSLDELKAKYKINADEEEAKKSASARVFEIPELLDQILGNLRPRESIGVQRVSREFYDSVAANSNTEKRTIFHVQSEDDMGGWRYTAFPWERYEDTEAEGIATAQGNGNAAWTDMLGEDWTPDDPEWYPEHQCTVVAGHVFGSFFVYMLANYMDPFQQLPTLTWPSMIELAKSSPIRKCFLYLQNTIYNHAGHWPHGWRGDFHNHSAQHITAEVDPNVADLWLEAACSIAKLGPDGREVDRFAEIDHESGVISLKQRKTSFSPRASTTLQDDPIYEFYPRE
ncbi:hypothetical protein PRZ48_008949 [Zasmidium cellare]|uniref:F-box domain-containing protein n=1 Tax=Zasmidium cellare TaxID=395010 RepID=A0ABR0EHB7_ZASCE|nr:hypothetical protein PRZ48_008949 [Zasmidium cellare]